MKADKDEFELESITDEAAEWVWKLDQGLSEDEQAAFEAWLHKDPQNWDALEKHRKSWKRMDGLTDLQWEFAEQPDFDSSRPKIWKWIPWSIAATAGLAAAILFMVVFRKTDTVPTPSPSIPMVVKNDYVRLPDGSRLFAGGNADFLVDYSPMRRRIILNSGEVYFSVAKDPQRPFIVAARGVELSALGTAFSVNLSEHSLELLVEEGKVKIASSSPGHTPSDPYQKETVLEVNQRATVTISDEKALVGQVEELSKEEVRRRMAWQHRRLVFDAQSLGEILHEFNRLNDIQFVLVSESLASTPLSGSLRSEDVEGLIRLLELGMEISVQRNENGVILLSQAPE